MRPSSVSPFQPAHCKSGNATAVFKGSGSSLTSAPGAVIDIATTVPPPMSGIRSRLVADSTERSAAFVSPWARSTGLSPGPGDHKHASALPVAHEEAAELVPGEPVGGTEAIGELLDRAVGQLDPVERARAEIGQQKVRCSIEQQAVRRVQGGETASCPAPGSPRLLVRSDRPPLPAPGDRPCQ